ncbi:MAG: nuclear transport factor 2 family protein [Vicinamibacterales bacterium]
MCVVLLALSVSASPASAQTRTMTAQEQTNLKMVSDWWREVIQAGHVEFADKYMAEDYMQHNPNINTGRAAFVTIFGRRAPRDIPAALTPAPVIQFAKGDYVVFVWEREAKDPMGNAYKYNFFDLVRVENGKVQEHWDSVFKATTAPAGQPVAGIVTQGLGPKPVKPRNTADEQKAEDIANIEFKDILQYGHLELADKLIAPGYIQHNPNVPTGRAGFVEFFKQFARPEPIKAEWKDEPELIITNGNLVFYMMRRFSTEPSDASKAYKWNWFDMVRVENGMVAEHWDMAMKSQPPASVPRPAGFKEYR